MTFISLIPPAFFNVKQYGAAGDGSTDDTTAIAAAITAATTNGGTVFFPAGTYITTTQTLASNVMLMGAGIGASILQLKNSTNGDLLSANTGNINLSAASGTSSSTAISNWGLRDITLDGNQANQSGTSYCLRVYGYAFSIVNVRMQNGLTGNWLNDWNGTGDTSTSLHESQVINLESYNPGGMCLEFGGPHNSQFANCQFYDSGSHCVHIAPNASGCLFINCEALTVASTAVAWLIEADFTACVGCVGRSSATVSNVVILGNTVRWTGGGRINSINTTGLQLGQGAGNTPYTGMINQSAGVTTAVTPTTCLVDAVVTGSSGSNGAIWLANDGGQNQIRATINQTSGSYVTGTPSTTTQLALQGTGLTPDGTIAKAAGQVNLLGQFATGQSASAPDPGASGTITTTGVGVARVNPSGGSRSGCILQAGTQPGQEVWVVNEHASNTITFAASGTSHVADGVSDVIAANSARKFIWDSSTSLWYKAS